jgi:hypothetical protein
MFKKNRRHLQIPLTSHVDELPEVLRKRLQNSWAETFYREFFCRLDEGPFAVLYADRPSRPNVPVNVLVGMEFLKAAHGWTDEDAYDRFCYDVQVRYALGYRHLGEGYFDLRTLYYFRERLARHVQETGENLLEQAFEQVTDEQLCAFSLKTGKQRMDSTQLASNIRQMGRVQLLVTVLQRVHRMLTEADRERYADLFAPYLKGHAGQYVYRLKQEELPDRLQQIGQDMQRLLDELEATYGQEPVYRVLARVFAEHFRLEQETLQAKANHELSADSLQSPDDLEATYREKRGDGYQGYVANLTETCAPDNPFQLITKVQVASNTTDDNRLLQDALPDLKERTGLETLFTDGGYGSPETDQAMQEQGIVHLPTAIRGPRRDENRLYLDNFDIVRDEQGTPEQITCPNGQSVPVSRPEDAATFLACFSETACQTCSLRNACPVKPYKTKPFSRLRFTETEMQRALRRQRLRAQGEQGRNLRAAVEATVRSVKHPFSAGKLPVRGRFRVTCMVLGSAAVSNVRRIYRALQAGSAAGREQKLDNREQNQTPKGAGDTFFSFSRPLWALL